MNFEHYRSDEQVMQVRSQHLETFAVGQKKVGDDSIDG